MSTGCKALKQRAKWTSVGPDVDLNADAVELAACTSALLRHFARAEPACKSDIGSGGGGCSSEGDGGQGTCEEGKEAETVCNG